MGLVTLCGVVLVEVGDGGGVEASWGIFGGGWWRDSIGGGCLSSSCTRGMGESFEGAVPPSPQLASSKEYFLFVLHF